MLLRQIDPDTLGEMFGKTAGGFATLIGSATLPTALPKLLGSILRFSMAESLRSPRSLEKLKDVPDSGSPDEDPEQEDSDPLAAPSDDKVDDTDPGKGVSENRRPLVGRPEEEKAAHQVGLDVIRRLKGRNIDFDDSVTERVASVVAEKFAAAKRNKISFSLEELGPEVSRENAIKSFVDAHRADRLIFDKGHVAELKVANIEAANANRILEETKGEINPTGFRRVIDTLGINHSFNRHGPGKEKTFQSAISPEAVSVYLDVVENFDQLSEPRRDERTGRTTVGFEKTINGKIVVVEEVRKGRKTLSFLSMWIKEK